MTALLLLVWGGWAPAQDPGLYLFQIPATRTNGAEGPLGEVIAANLHVRSPEQLLLRLSETSVAVLAVEESAVRLAIGRRETLLEDPGSEHGAASFVIDYDELPVAKLVNKLQERYTIDPSIAQLVEFTDVAIANKSYRRQFDLASQIAISGEGDCTEHAVLLAALARATGKPARVVIGLLLVEAPDNVMTYGHAWTEIHDGNTWQIADATRPEAQVPGGRSRYVPLVGLHNEGPGYALQLADVAAVYPLRVEEIETASRLPE